MRPHICYCNEIVREREGEEREREERERRERERREKGHNEIAIQTQHRKLEQRNMKAFGNQHGKARSVSEYLDNHLYSKTLKGKERAAAAAKEKETIVKRGKKSFAVTFIDE